MDTHREVVHDPERHTRLECRGLHLRQLLGQLPLEPPVEVDLGGVHGLEVLDHLRVARRERGWPLLRSTILLRDGAPGREGRQALSLGGAELLESRPLGHRAEHLPQRLTLERPGGVAVDHVTGVERLRQLRQRQHRLLIEPAERVEPGQTLHPKVDRVGEAPRGREVRR